ncbi:AAA family ATPase [Gorillibacterium sp. sgz5001074]|uniref:AAA family ATPase n=1 Tax=Gorillibacterium sp. sgz5001074 TaxID=3446695 RepID=UPI003F6727D6
MELSEIYDLGRRVRENVKKVIVGKDEVIDQLLTAMLASGHVLLEDVPGTGKTLLAKALARSLNTEFARVQFTPDLLPTDVSGVNIYDMKRSEFEFRPGPVFTHVLLADEINRATPRTQSVLLECMEERQVTIDGVTRRLEQPFLVIATQNPLENQGTFPLPEAQLDRFMLKVAMGYPDSAESVEILKRFRAEDPLETLRPVAEAAEIRAAQASYTKVTVDDDLYAYIVALAEETRRDPELLGGVSPRGCLSMLRAAQARAVLAGRGYVSPDDIKALAVPVWAHRVLPARRGGAFERVAEKAVLRIVNAVPVPTEAPAALQGRG